VPDSQEKFQEGYGTGTSTHPKSYQEKISHSISIGMFAKIAVDSIVFLHFLWVIFLVLGAFIGRRYRWVKILHLSGMGFAIIIQVFKWYCPLTYLEFWLRQYYGSSRDYPSSFIIYYLERIVYIDLSGEIIFAATIVLVLISAMIYLYNPREK
jgi:hypothetical protein